MRGKEGEMKITLKNSALTPNTTGSIIPLCLFYPFLRRRGEEGEEEGKRGEIRRGERGEEGGERGEVEVNERRRERG